MIRLRNLRTRLRPGPPRPRREEAPPQPRNGAGPVPPWYLTRSDGLIRVDETGAISIIRFDPQTVGRPDGYPYPEVPAGGWWQHALTMIDGPHLPIWRPYTDVYPTWVELGDAA